MTQYSNTIIESIGTIEKKETLVSLSYNDLVLESLHPFPGYHGTNVPDKPNPKSIFLILKTKYDDEQIVRATLKIRENYPSTFDASPGTVAVFNHTEPCIRIKGLENYQLIPELVALYKAEGLSFMKGKKIEAYEGLIRIKKYFILDEVNEGIYMDKETPEMGYFEIDGKLEWDLFEKITIEIKQNLEDNNFDAALGTIYRKKGLKDIIRIYDTNVCLGECLFLSEKFNNAINRYKK